jgi:hypothetical protein
MKQGNNFQFADHYQRSRSYFLVRLLIRAFIHITLFLLLATSAFANKDYIQRPQSLTIRFSTIDRATFVFSNSVVTAITLHVGSVDYTVPATACAKLRDIRFDSVTLLRNSHKSADEADYFGLRFDMGTESARAFGELPHVQLMYEDGKFRGTFITKKTAQDTWQDSKL